jgi:hypothetical protein
MQKMGKMGEAASAKPRVVFNPAKGMFVNEWREELNEWIEEMGGEKGRAKAGEKGKEK